MNASTGLQISIQNGLSIGIVANHFGHPVSKAQNLAARGPHESTKLPIFNKRNEKSFQQEGSQILANFPMPNDTVS